MVRLVTPNCFANAVLVTLEASSQISAFSSGSSQMLRRLGCTRGRGAIPQAVLKHSIQVPRIPRVMYELHFGHLFEFAIAIVYSHVNVKIFRKPVSVLFEVLDTLFGLKVLFAAFQIAPLPFKLLR